MHLRPLFYAVWGAALIGAAYPAFGQETTPVTASQTAIIQADGPKTGATGERYFNVEGKGKGKYADFGVVRFDLSKLKTTLDQKYGAGKYRVVDIELALTQSNASFTANGDVEVYYTPNDTTDVQTLKYPYDPKGKALPGSLVASGKFVRGGVAPQEAAATGGKAADASEKSKGGALDTFECAKSRGFGALAKHVLLGKTVTLVLREGDPNVAATWAGKSSTNFKPPVLVVKTEPTRK